MRAPWRRSMCRRDSVRPRQEWRPCGGRSLRLQPLPDRLVPAAGAAKLDAADLQRGPVADARRALIVTEAIRGKKRAIPEMSEQGVRTLRQNVRTPRLL